MHHCSARCVLLWLLKMLKTLNHEMWNQWREISGTVKTKRRILPMYGSVSVFHQLFISYYSVTSLYQTSSNRVDVFDIYELRNTQCAGFLIDWQLHGWSGMTHKTRMAQCVALHACARSVCAVHTRNVRLNALKVYKLNYFITSSHHHHHFVQRVCHRRLGISINWLYNGCVIHCFVDRQFAISRAEVVERNISRDAETSREQINADV